MSATDHPTVRGIDREVLADVIREAAWPMSWARADAAADAAIAYVAAHHKCADAGCEVVAPDYVESAYRGMALLAAIRDAKETSR